jgi:hypothetical protein
MKITNYKSQITSKFQIPVTEITKIINKQITAIIMGYDIKEHSTMTDRVWKSFWKSRNLFSKRFLAAGGK